MLSGISVEYYTHLERGKATGVSHEVLDANARTLQLDDAERAHLFDLVRTAATGGPVRRRPSQERVRPAVQRILDSMLTVPAYVRNGRLDILAANQLGKAVYSQVFKPISDHHHRSEAEARQKRRHTIDCAYPGVARGLIATGTARFELIRSP
jgi:MmyB-like transcription regulator ligand binding domain